MRPQASCLRVLQTPPLASCVDAGSADGPSQRLQYLRDHHGFDCICGRCTCDDILKEAELAEGLDAIRCCCDGCHAGLSYPLAADGNTDGSEVTIAKEVGGYGATPAEPDEGATSLRQCVLCGGQFCAALDEY